MATSDDGTSCYGDCSGHGVCIEYQCQCDTGFYGEDCSLSACQPPSRFCLHVCVTAAGRAGYVKPGSEVIPVLEAGHYKIGSCSNITRAGRRADVLVVGFSSQSCDRCVSFEAEYRAAEGPLRQLGVSLACSKCSNRCSRSTKLQIDCISLGCRWNSPALTLQSATMWLPS